MENACLSFEAPKEAHIAPRGTRRVWAAAAAPNVPADFILVSERLVNFLVGRRKAAINAIIDDYEGQTREAKRTRLIENIYSLAYALWENAYGPIKSCIYKAVSMVTAKDETAAAAENRKAKKRVEKCAKVQEVPFDDLKLVTNGLEHDDPEYYLSLVDSINRLDEYDKMLLSLYLGEDAMSLRDIGALLGKNHQTVCYRIKRAVKKLKEILIEEGLAPT